MDSRTATAADVGQDGSVYTHPSESPVYAVIGLEEYLDGSQDWTLCTPSDLGPVGPPPPDDPGCIGQRKSAGDFFGYPPAPDTAERSCRR